MNSRYKHELRPYRRLHAPIYSKSYSRAAKTELNSPTIACINKSEFVSISDINILFVCYRKIPKPFIKSR